MPAPMRGPSPGFTLIELLIAVAILALITAIAMPAYQGYIRESRLGAMRTNLDTLRVAVEAFKLDDLQARYNPGSATSYVYSSSSTTIKSAYGWQPEGSEAYRYEVSGITATIYSLTAETEADGGAFWVRCDKDPDAKCAFNCCGSDNKAARKGNLCPMCP